MAADSDRAAVREQANLQSVEQTAFRFLDAVPVGIFITAADGQPYYANPEAVRLLGRGVLPSASPPDLSESYQVTVRGTDIPYPAERSSLIAALAGHTTATDDAAIRRPDGTVVPAEIWSAPLTGPDGSVEFAITAFVDVSGRLHAEEALQAVQEQFHASVEVLSDGFALFSAVRDAGGRIADFRYEYINEAACRMDLRTREETVGHTLIELFPGCVPAGLFGAYAEVAGTGEPLVREDVDYEDVYGGRRVARAFDIRAVKLSDGIMVTWRDVAERRQAQELLARQAAELERAAAELEERVRSRTADLVRSNQELESFGYSVAHDLRTPLRAIQGYSQILLDEHAGQLDEDGQALLRDVGRYTGRMSELIDDLLALADVGRRDVECARINMTALTESVVADLRPTLADGWRPAVDGWPAIVVSGLAGAVGDPALIRQVWANLLSNAVKFSAGQPFAEVSVTSETTADEVIYHVRDNGVGFDMAHAGELFGTFHRLHGAEFAGTGIGLAIVSRIVGRHGGRVWAEGHVNGGACFSFALPVRQPVSEV